MVCEVSCVAHSFVHSFIINTSDGEWGEVSLEGVTKLTKPRLFQGYRIWALSGGPWGTRVFKPRSDRVRFAFRRLLLRDAESEQRGVDHIWEVSVNRRARRSGIEAGGGRWR